jgi:hypothetical protein
VADLYAGEQSYPGQGRLTIPETPSDPLSYQMLTAHRVNDTATALAHAMERVTALKKAKTAKLRHYHSTHLANHLSFALDNMHVLAQNLRDHYPAEGRELDAVKQTVGLARSVSAMAKTATTAHLTETGLHELTHGKRHADLMLKADPLAEWLFNFDHARKHVLGAHEHVLKLAEHLIDNYPAEGRWLRLLQQLSSGSGDAKYVKASAPGSNDQYGLHQVPSQTVSPSPPMPSSVPLPSAKECLALIKIVPNGIDISLSNTVRQALRMAALKLEKNDVIMALACLRQAQAALYSASRKDAGSGRPAVYGAQAVPPAEQGSALFQMMRAYQDQAQAWRKIGIEVAHLIDRVRRHYFAGRVNGVLPNLRMSAGDDC